MKRKNHKKDLASRLRITEKEFLVLRALLTNEYPLVESDSINDAKFPSGIEGKALGGVVVSLIRKGLIETDIHEDLRVLFANERAYREMMDYADKNNESYPVLETENYTDDMDYSNAWLLERFSYLINKIMRDEQENPQSKFNALANVRAEILRRMEK